MYMYFKLHTYNDNAYSPCISFLLLAVTKHAGQRHLSERLSLPQLRGYKSGETEVKTQAETIVHHHLLIHGLLMLS